MALSTTVLCLFVYYYFNVEVIFYRKHTKVIRGGSRSNRKSNEASGSVRNPQEVSGSSRKRQEASERQDIKIIINKQTKYSGSESTKQTLK